MDRLSFESGLPELDFPGGNLVITASALATTGAPCRAIGMLGHDVAGHAVRDLMAGHGVDVSLVELSDASSTKLARNWVANDGSWLRQSSHPDPVPYLRDRSDAEWPEASLFFACGLNGLLCASGTATEHAVSVYRARETQLAFGLASIHFDAARFRVLIEDDDLLFASDAEIACLLGVAQPDAHDLARSLLSSRFRHCVVTCGSRGVIARWEDQILRVRNGRSQAEILRSVSDLAHALADSSTPAVQSNDPLCSVGAGDVFAGVFTGFLLRGVRADKALALACLAASASTRSTRWDGFPPNFEVP